MANKPMDTSFLDRALIFAIESHSNTERRNKGFPYIVHPLEAVAIASTMSSDQEVLAAAAMHDVVEDTNVTLEQIRAEFGDKVATLVDADSDVNVEGMSEADSWKFRKQNVINRLSVASRDAKIVALSDKLSNMRAIARDHELYGNDVWNMFSVKDITKHAWRFRALAAALSELSGTFAYREYIELLDKVFGKN